MGGGASIGGLRLLSWWLLLLLYSVGARDLGREEGREGGREGGRKEEEEGEKESGGRD